ncbi:MAG: 5-formyltetrahydrofolate cyclo-ligase [Nitriliruptoraceae bacterium]
MTPQHDQRAEPRHSDASPAASWRSPTASSTSGIGETGEAADASNDGDPTAGADPDNLRDTGDDHNGGEIIIKAKRQLRSQMRQARRRLDPATVATASEAVASRLITLPEITHAHVVMIYGAAPDEIDPQGCEQPLRDRGARITYPRVEGNRLMVVEVAANSAFSTGFAGIQEPLGPPTDPQTVDVVVVPGLGFDRTGRRLGQGKGYYDQLLPTMRAIRIAVAFDEQIVDEIPTDAHDQAMDVIVTPSQLIRCS